ncbi:Glycosyltransferase involved in cell wall bisynthesis [Seinonella peptonophila]|uniref:Glycosyltransferase involved in cell wall bisynthesis n=1 Tax=Seinonella peptonophila TaxID=112248 RepID=A0A1M4X9V4_9BACL|nr:glycosyltransferase family 2 protein [Seinonella peptonophila]SHE90288.1 Glycosyltransferase involved in cell wall bisynthesis [Seinonella peptonophila]
MISIITPCFNEEDVLNAFYDEIQKVMKKFDFELIFVDDGSQDRTLHILQELGNKDQRVRYLSFSRNFGKEAAMLAGLTYARGEAAVIMDSDLQHPPSMIPKMIEAYQEGYDQVIAKRNRKDEKWTRSFTAKLYYKLINHFVDHITLTDGVGDFRLLSRRAIDALLALSEYNRFSKGLFSWIGFKEHLLEYENVDRALGQSKWTFFKLLNYGIDGIISFNNRPLRVAIYMGLFTMSIDLLYVLYILIKTIVHGVDVPGYVTIISAVLLLGGIQMLFLGVIGEYIGRIYYEAKKRPHYVIAEDNVSGQIKKQQQKQRIAH